MPASVYAVEQAASSAERFGYEPEAPAPASSGLRCDAPEGWLRQPPRPMREITFDAQGAECYVAVLGGAAGGVEANVNRWRTQIGLPPMTGEEAAALPEIPMMGGVGALAELANPDSDEALLGAVCPRADHTVFVKLTGTPEQVARERGRFLAFCASLRWD